MPPEVPRKLLARRSLRVRQGLGLSLILIGRSITSFSYRLSLKGGGKKRAPRALPLSFTGNASSRCLRARNSQNYFASHRSISASSSTMPSRIQKEANDLTRRTRLVLPVCRNGSALIPQKNSRPKTLRTPWQERLKRRSGRPPRSIITGR
jgi:hypothetical protein